MRCLFIGYIKYGDNELSINQSNKLYIHVTQIRLMGLDNGVITSVGDDGYPFGLDTLLLMTLSR